MSGKKYLLVFEFFKLDKLIVLVMSRMSLGMNGQILLTVNTRWNIKLFKTKSNSFQMLWILESIDKIPAVDFW